MSKSIVGRVVAILVVLGVLAGAPTGYYLYQKREQPLGVQTERVQKRDLTELVEATGKIQPVTLVKISPEVSGEIIELPVKEGQLVKKGDLLLKIKPDYYTANCNSAEANLKSCLASTELAKANLEKAEAEFKRIKQLFEANLVSESQFVEARTAGDVARAQVDSSTHQADVARASLARAEEELSKTIIVSPLTGTISKLNSQLGERVVGTATMAGTEVMSIADLDDMEARVDLGEMDVVLIAVGQKARLEVDAFRAKPFSGTVTEIANTAKMTASQQEATKFEVRIRVSEKQIFRPGMSVTAKIETRYRTNVLTVPIQSVTTRAPKTPATNSPGLLTSSAHASDTAPTAGGKKKDDPNKPIEVVFTVNSDTAEMVPVKRGISDETYVEIVEGLREGQEIVSGGYIALNRELQDGKRVKVGAATAESARTDRK